MELLFVYLYIDKTNIKVSFWRKKWGDIVSLYNNLSGGCFFFPEKHNHFDMADSLASSGEYKQLFVIKFGPSCHQLLLHLTPIRPKCLLEPQC